VNREESEKAFLETIRNLGSSSNGKSETNMSSMGNGTKVELSRSTSQVDDV